MITILRNFSIEVSFILLLMAIIRKRIKRNLDWFLIFMEEIKINWNKIETIYMHIYVNNYVYQMSIIFQ